MATKKELETALSDLLRELRQSRFKMDVKKDFSLMVAESEAQKTLYKLNKGK